MMWVGFLQSVERPKEKNQGFPWEKEMQKHFLSFFTFLKRNLLHRAKTITMFCEAVTCVKGFSLCTWKYIGQPSTNDGGRGEGCTL